MWIICVTLLSQLPHLLNRKCISHRYSAGKWNRSSSYVSCTALTVLIIICTCLTQSFQKEMIYRTIKKCWKEEVEIELDLKEWVGFQKEEIELGRRIHDKRKDRFQRSVGQVWKPHTGLAGVKVTGSKAGNRDWDQIIKEVLPSQLRYLNIIL